MHTHYYLTVFPSEALIASQLEPAQFGSYMATGSRKGSSERLIFIEIEGRCTDAFDWDYAEKRCVPHPNGDPKHSVYLAVYRALERIPLKAFGSLYLTTQDGRTLGLSKEEFRDSENRQNYSVYKELCPVSPVVVSALRPDQFSAYITDPDIKIAVPSIIFADLKTPNLEDPDNSGNIGNMYSSKISHLLECIAAVESDASKKNKTFDRSNVESFTFQVINNGIYVGSGGDIIMYRMPGIEDIKKIDYDWGRSALII